MATPAATGATGTVTRSLRKNLDAIPGKHSTDSLQKTSILGTSHIIREVLQSETGSLSGGDHRWLNRSAREKWPVARDNIIIIIIIIIINRYLLKCSSSASFNCKASTKTQQIHKQPN
jgi:hypothetical protein